MSRTIAEAINAVRYNLNDRNPSKEAFIEPEYVMAIQAAVRLLAGSLIPGEEWQLGLVTTIAGVAEYNLTSQKEWSHIKFFRSQRDGLEITVIPFSLFEAYRTGEIGSLSDRGYPRVAYIREDASQLVTVRFFPIPIDHDLLDVFLSRLPTPFYVDGTLQLTALPENTAIPFDDFAFQALCYTVSIELYNRMTDEQKAANNLVQMWRRVGQGM